MTSHWLAMVDLEGQLRGKWTKGDSLLPSHLWLCDCQDEDYEIFYEGVKNIPVVIDRSYQIPLFGNDPLTVHMTHPEGKRQQLDSRQQLSAFLQHSHYLPQVGIEIEFIVQKNSLENQLYAGHSLSQWGGYSELFDYIETLSQYIPIESFHREQGPCMMEISLSPLSPLEAADYASLLKCCLKNFCQKMGMVANFMPRPTQEEVGQGLHLHIDSTDGPEDALNILSYAPELMVFYANTPNAYKRYGLEQTPSKLDCKIDDKSAAVRVLADRLENRLPGAHANIYLALAATLWSMHQEKRPFLENSSIPRDLIAAIDLFQPMRGHYFASDAFHDLYVTSRKREATLVTHQLTHWEVERYLHPI